VRASLSLFAPDFLVFVWFFTVFALAQGKSSLSMICFLFGPRLSFSACSFMLAVLMLLVSLYSKTGAVAHAAMQVDPSCRQFVDELWTLQPRGEGQLQAIQVMEIQPKWNTSYPHYPTKEELIGILHHGKNPYDALEVHERMGSDVYVSYAQQNAQLLQNFTSKHFRKVAPKLLIEVGSFVGSGMLHVWAPMLEKGGLALAVDTWQGDINMRLGSGFQHFMALKHGHPTVYQKFIQVHTQTYIHT